MKVWDLNPNFYYKIIFLNFWCLKNEKFLMAKYWMKILLRHRQQMFKKTIYTSCFK